MRASNENERGQTSPIVGSESGSVASRMPSSVHNAGDGFAVREVEMLAAREEGFQAGVAQQQVEPSSSGKKSKSRKTQLQRFSLRSPLFVNVVHMANNETMASTKSWKRFVEDLLGCLSLVSLAVVFVSVECLFEVNNGVPLTSELFGDAVIVNETWENLKASAEAQAAWKWVHVNSSWEAEGNCTPSGCSDFFANASCCEYYQGPALTWETAFQSTPPVYYVGCVFAGLLEFVTLVMVVLVWVKYYLHVQLSAIKHGSMLRFEDKKYLFQSVLEAIFCLAHIPYPISYMVQEDYNGVQYYYPLLTFNIVLVLPRLYTVAYIVKNHPGFKCNLKFAHAMGVEADSIVFVLKMLCQSNPALIFWPLVLIDVFVVAIPVWVLERTVPDGTIHEFDIALWFAFVAISSVGFGDYYPITAVGQAIVVVGAVILGIVILGLTTAFLVDFTQLSPNEEEVVSEIRMVKWKDKQAVLQRKHVVAKAMRKFLKFYLNADKRVARDKDADLESLELVDIGSTATGNKNAIVEADDHDGSVARGAASTQHRSMEELSRMCHERRQAFRLRYVRLQRMEQNSQRRAREHSARQPILLNGVRRVLMQDRVQRTLQVKLDQIMHKQIELKAMLSTLGERLDHSVQEMVRRDEESRLKLSATHALSRSVSNVSASESGSSPNEAGWSAPTSPAQNSQDTREDFPEPVAEHEAFDSALSQHPAPAPLDLSNRQILGDEPERQVPRRNSSEEILGDDHRDMFERLQAEYEQGQTLAPRSQDSS